MYFGCGCKKGSRNQRPQVTKTIQTVVPPTPVPNLGPMIAPPFVEPVDPNQTNGYQNQPTGQ